MPAAAKSRPIAAPEPALTPSALLERAIALRPYLRAHQAECEALGRVPDAVNARLIAEGFYRTVQPRRFGGYEFDVPTFFRVMMEIARGCAETGWVLALTAGHPLLVASFPEEGQREVYGKDGEFRCPASFNPPGKAVPVEGGYRITGGWASASGIDHATHYLGGSLVVGEDGKPTDKVIQMILDRDQFEIVDDWRVMGMQGTGSKTVAARDVFVPAHRTLAAVAAGRGSEPVRGPRSYDNPMYGGRVAPFLIGEAASVAVGAARGALDLYEEVVTTKKTFFPPFHERAKEADIQHTYGRALALVATAEAALVGAGEEYMAFAREAAEGGHSFDDERDQRITLIEHSCTRMAFEAVETLFRTAGTSSTAKEGQPLGRVFRNLAVIGTHPAMQLDRMAIAAARTKFGLPPR
ncbi:MAG TPA: acyl-CoA dehydrogenase family protein [Hyphomicrobiales bacterium]|nr:acyl-CoA dehydrogenase family protein [Hyphomicrobiales bacterium]